MARDISYSRYFIQKDTSWPLEYSLCQLHWQESYPKADTVCYVKDTYILPVTSVAWSGINYFKSTTVHLPTVCPERYSLLVQYEQLWPYDFIFASRLHAGAAGGRLSAPPVWLWRAGHHADAATRWPAPPRPVQELSLSRPRRSSRLFRWVTVVSRKIEEKSSSFLAQQGGNFADTVARSPVRS